MLQKEREYPENAKNSQDCKIELLDNVMSCFERKFMELFQESVYMKNPFSEKKVKSAYVSFLQSNFSWEERLSFPREPACTIILIMSGKSAHILCGL